MSNGDGEGAVREALKKIHDVEKSVKDFEEHESDLLAQRINAFVSSLEDVRKTLGVVEARGFSVRSMQMGSDGDAGVMTLALARKETVYRLP